ncbi:MAG TPA: MAPEG family protein [Rhizomicrobium sp.]|nr:MAPEG family protein [Rhizomicrobium sp.]
MTLAEWMIFAAVLLYLLTLAPVKVVGRPRFDNSHPRDPAFYTPGIRASALGAHINGIETFPFFAAAVLLAEFRHRPQHWIDLLAIAFIVLRLAFVAAYLADRPTLRTLLWNFGFAVNTAIFFLPWWSSR